MLLYKAEAQLAIELYAVKVHRIVAKPTWDINDRIICGSTSGSIRADTNYPTTRTRGTMSRIWQC